MKRKPVDLVKTMFGKSAFWRRAKNLEHCVRLVFLENFNVKRREDVKEWLNACGFETGVYKGKKFWLVDAEEISKMERDALREKILRLFKRKIKGREKVYVNPYSIKWLRSPQYSIYYEVAREIGFEITSAGAIILDSCVLSDYLNKKRRRPGRPCTGLKSDDVEKLYYEKGSLRKVADVLGVSKSTVHNILKKGRVNQ